MLKKLIVTLIASAFALTAFAQAPKSDTTPASPAPAEKKADGKTAKKGKATKGEKKSSKAKAKAKSDNAAKAKSDEAKK